MAGAVVERQSGFSPRPTVLLACAVFKEVLSQRLAGTGIRPLYMDFGLHVRPRRMAPALQEQLDRLPSPSTVLLGYGLCGGGIEGLRAGRHTLIVPRAHDCIALLLGSRQEDLRARAARPGTYYLTLGWLESGHHPLGQYRQCLARYGEDEAGHIVDALYARYTDLVYLAATVEELRQSRPRAREVAAFCASRWGMGYAELVGAPTLIDGLLSAQPPSGVGEDFLVVPPGGTLLRTTILRS